MRDAVYSCVEKVLTSFKGRPYRLDRRVPLTAFVGLVVRRMMWLVRGLVKTTFFQLRPRMIFIGPSVELRTATMCRFGKSVTIERGTIIDGLSERGVKLGDDVAIGAYSIIRASTATHLGAGMEIGKNSSCDAYSFFGAGGFISIGENVIMGQHVCFHAETHNTERTDIPIRAQGVTKLPITIEDDCWIGANVTFLGGAHVGRGSIVAAGAVVNKSYPPYSVIVGVPARVVRSRTEAVSQLS